MARIGVVPRTAICTAQAAAAYIEAGDYFNAANMGELLLRQIQTLVEAGAAVSEAKLAERGVRATTIAANTLVIVQSDVHGTHKTGSLSPSLSKADIDKALKGRVKTTLDDPYKVKYFWGFTVDGVPCAIWDYKGARWSTFGPAEKLRQLFGGLYSDGAF